MADFVSAQRNLKTARATLEAARATEAAARETLRAVNAQGAVLARSSNPKSASDLEAQRGVARNTAAATGALTAASAAVAAAAQGLGKALAAFQGFTDPRQGLSALDSQFPISLLPVRVETRFAANPSEKGRRQLWVRIYPDDCWIDSFEPTLSADELANTKKYWAEFWRAGGVEADQRAAWRSLVAAHGSGRANFLLDSFAPQNAPPPAKAAPTDVILVIPTGTAPAPADSAPLATYWQAIWLADGDKTDSGAALTALQAAVGARANQLLSDYQPFNLADQPMAPLARNAVTLSTSFVVFPADPPAQAAAWSRAPRVTHFPDCFVVLGFNNSMLALSAVGTPITLPLFVGPDPSVAPDQTIHVDPATGELVVPDDLKWMVDFPAAVAAGVGLAIDLNVDQASMGFDRLLVLGVQLSASAEDGQAALAEILSHHAMSGSGLAVLAQGTPTHNTTGTGSGYSRVDDPDRSFDDRKDAPLFTPTADVTHKRDGQCLAEALGLDPGVFFRVHGADGQDQLQARAMQNALWPATLGYWMDKLMTPVFGDATVDSTRWFFTNYVRGRGVVPAIRIAAQPYGVLPTTAFSRIGWLAAPAGENSIVPAGEAAFLATLYALLRRFDADWAQMSSAASYVGKAGDPHQTLLDILGLHPDSSEFYSRYAESLAELWNLINLRGDGPTLWRKLQELQVAGMQRLQGLGYAGGDPPDLLQQFFIGTATLIGTIVDDVPPSESAPVRSHTDDGRNYLRWLYDAATNSLDALQQEQGFSGSQTPQALLYLLLRHALMLGYYDTSYRLYRSAGFLTPAQLAAMKPEPAFVHVDATVTASESRFAALYTVEPRVTSSPTLLVSDYITAQYANLPEAENFARQLAALSLLENVSTAALERLLAEHVDTCSYRFDSWLLGLVALQLESMRSIGAVTEKRLGTYLGAYAWLEEVRPSTTVLQPANVPPNIAEQFPGTAPLMVDAGNGGYIAAPSVPQAKTAAVLRSGYLANATQDNPQPLSVNLSSDRVRLALSLLEGIRNGQSLGALLGYRFERGLHDDYGLAEVDKFIYPLRKAFPLVADAAASTQTAPGVPIEAIEARNVLDGRKLIAQIQASGQATYPFGWTATPLPVATPAEAAAINQEANRLLDANDAVADLALAEGVHQAVQGNFDRLAGTLETYSTGNFPPDPEVVQTPAGGVSVTQRIAVHFTAGLQAPANTTPRATAEPALDDWLGRILPPLASVRCTATWNDPLTNAPQSTPVSLADLKLRAIDVVALVRPDNLQAMTELDDRVVSFVLATNAPRPDSRISISYLAAPAGGNISMFAASGLIRSVRALLARARPLRVTDALQQSGVSGNPNANVTIDATRVSAPLASYLVLSADMATYLTNLAPLVQNPVANRAALLNSIDDLLAQAAALLERAARFSLPQSGWGFILDWKRAAFADLIAVVSALVTRWAAKLTDYNAKLAAYNALPGTTSNADLFQALRAMELVVSTKLARLPATPTLLFATVAAKALAFKNLRDRFVAVTQTADPLFSHLLASVSALLPISDFDAQPFTLTDFGNRVITAAQDLYRTMTGHKAAVDSRYAAANAAVTEAANTADARQRTAALQKAAKALLGDDFTLYSEFGLSTTQAAEWANAYAAGTSGALLNYLTQTEKIDFPVDEWLAGVARVRPALHAWESITNLASAMQPVDLSLTPVQFPFVATAPWVAMQYDPKYTVGSEHLLYTAQYPPAGFDPTKPQCGLLLDEWTEVIPSADRTAGITFNYDRPNSEAPQSILVVTPATVSPIWQWDDLVGALNETLDLAKKRALEPVQIDPTIYARFLPATISVATTYAITISATLAATNGVYNRMQVTS
jgi:hypothetical protein